MIVLSIRWLAERVGFEPTYTLLRRNSISSRARYNRFGTSPIQSLSKRANLLQRIFAVPGRDFYAKMRRFSAITFILPSSMGVGWLIGHYLIDRNLDSSPWGTIALVFLGAGAGFYQIIRILMPPKK